jgi:hypothetical protein
LWLFNKKRALKRLFPEIGASLQNIYIFAEAFKNRKDLGSRVTGFTAAGSG